MSEDHVHPVLAPGLESLDCGACTLCIDICPGRDTGVTASEMRLHGRTRSPEERWTGIFLRTYSARAKDPHILKAASAGGVGTALLVSAMQRGEIDAALVVGRDAERPWVPQARMVDSVDAIIDCAQATYCVTPNLQLLRQQDFERVAVVGLACEIEAIEKMRNLAVVPDVAKRIAFTIELACASNTSRQGTEHLIENRLHLPLTDVASMRYRAGDYPGAFTVVDSNGTTRQLPFHELVEEFKRFKPFRCLACPDWWSGLADISIADDDPNIFKTSRNLSSAPKASLVMTRTAAGQSLLDASASDGSLELSDTVFTPQDSLGLQRKRHRYADYHHKFPNQTPTPPVSGVEVARPLTDDRVIERMSGQ